MQDNYRDLGRRSFQTALFGAVGMLALLTGCQGGGVPASELSSASTGQYAYVIGPGDNLEIFVWRNPELSKSVPVRPDGRISVPLVEELTAAGKTPEALAREVEERLGTYVRDPLVTILVSGFEGTYGTQVRVVGEATKPATLPYRDNMTLLDVMIAVGGLTEFAAGNRAQLVREIDGKSQSATVRIEDLVKDGDITANLPVAPGDIIIIPETWF